MFKKLLLIACMTIECSSFGQDIPPINSIGDANALIDKLKKNTIPQLHGIHRCFIDVGTIVDNYRGLKHLWVGKNKTNTLPLLIEAKTETVADGLFDINIYRNFDGLGVYQKQFFSDLQKFILTYNIPAANTLEGLQDHILKIDQGKLAFSDKFYEMAKKDSLYLQLLDNIKIEAEKEHSRLAAQAQYIISSRCKNVSLEPVAGFIEADARSVIGNIEKLRAFTLDSIDKRNLIVKRSYQEIRQKYVDEYQLMAGQQLGQFGSVATDVLSMAKVGEEMLSWWISANMNGLANSLHLKYLQFENARDLLLVEKYRASKFETEIRSIKYAPPSMSSYYLTRLSSFHKIIEDNLKIVEERGWKGQLERQVLLNSKRKSAAARLTSNCVNSLQKHLDASSQTKTIEQFRDVEKLYAISLEMCKL